MGLIKGLQMLEKLESYALFVTLFVVLILSAGFLSYDEKQLTVYSSSECGGIELVEDNANS